MKFNPINPKICYIVNELDSTTSVFAWDECSETLDLVDIVSTIPSTFVGENYAAELDVARNGKRIYISNRGHDSIVSFRLADSGAIVAGGEWTQAGGKWPRFIGLDDDDESLWVAAQNSDVVCRFSVDVHSGSLRLEESKRFHAPAFVTSI